MVVELLVGCRVWCNDRERHVLLDKERPYLLDHAVLMRFHGTVDRLFKSERLEPAARLYSAPAFRELVSVAGGHDGGIVDSDFHDLPQHILDDVKQTIWKKGGLHAHVTLAHFNREIADRPGCFAVDTVHNGKVYVRLQHEKIGTVSGKVWFASKEKVR